jgi:CRISPR-associated protein Cas5d
MRSFVLEVSGDFACFTRPEMKVERVSYDVITPSAARAVFEAILWKPAISWQISKIEVLKPIRWISVRRNEVAAKVSTRNVQTIMHEGRGNFGMYVEEDRQQRAALILRDVGYRLHASMAPVSGDALTNTAKYHEMFVRRAEKGQCVNQPYLGCREFAARVTLAEVDTSASLPISETRDLGWMLHDLDFSDVTDPKPKFFRAEMIAGVIDLTTAEVRG